MTVPELPGQPCNPCSSHHPGIRPQPRPAGASAPAGTAFPWQKGEIPQQRETPSAFPPGQHRPPATRRPVTGKRPRPNGHGQAATGKRPRASGHGQAAPCAPCPSSLDQTTPWPPFCVSSAGRHPVRTGPAELLITGSRHHRGARGRPGPVSDDLRKARPTSRFLCVSPGPTGGRPPSAVSGPAVPDGQRKNADRREANMPEGGRSGRPARTARPRMDALCARRGGRQAEAPEEETGPGRPRDQIPSGYLSLDFFAVTSLLLRLQ